jgi:predicted metalloendopeptidase
MVSQYSSFKIDQETNVNGKLTLGENIADCGGLKLAYNGWKTKVDSKHVVEMPSNLGHMTLEQLFFINFSQVWCSVEPVKETIRRSLTEVHSPPQFRTNGAVSNMKEFAEAFSCKPNQPMNPDNKCSVW